MAARYKRTLSPEILDALMPKGELKFLLSDLHFNDPHAIDIQLREKDTLMYYHGTTSLLTLVFRCAGGKISVKATADRAYRKRPEYHELMNLWSKIEKDKLLKALRI